MSKQCIEWLSMWHNKQIVVRWNVSYVSPPQLTAVAVHAVELVTTPRQSVGVQMCS